MKTYLLKDFYQEEFGEYVLGPRQIGNAAGYMAMGELGPGESRRLSPGDGHEEIILVVSGSASVDGASVSSGEAFYLPSGGKADLKAGERGCTYVSAGAHTDSHGHDK